MPLTVFIILIYQAKEHWGWNVNQHSFWLETQLCVYQGGHWYGLQNWFFSPTQRWMGCSVTTLHIYFDKIQINRCVLFEGTYILTGVKHNIIINGISYEAITWRKISFSNTENYIITHVAYIKQNAIKLI